MASPLQGNMMEMPLNLHLAFKRNELWPRKRVIRYRIAALALTPPAALHAPHFLILAATWTTARSTYTPTRVRSGGQLSNRSRSADLPLQDFQVRVRKLAKLLVSLGVRPGDRCGSAAASAGRQFAHLWL